MDQGQRKTDYPRLMIAAPSSGSGKTLISCGLLEAFSRRGLKLSSFKCGPDYIDPMFHRKVLGSASANLDTFCTDEETTGYLLRRYAAGSDLSILEGVMGYYDGLGGSSETASSYDLARVTKTPVVLIVDAKGMSLSAAATLRGFADFRKPSRIRGVILNRVSPMLYPVLKEAIERELNERTPDGSGQKDGSAEAGNGDSADPGAGSAEQIRVFGYVPKMEALELKSRHLGLIMPDELEGLKEKLGSFAAQLEKTVDLDGLYALAREAEGDCRTSGEALCGQKEEGCVREKDLLPETANPCLQRKQPAGSTNSGKKIRIALAQDEAFCFAYAENLALLEEMGAELVPFSPLSDRGLPPGSEGLLLYGGYPELYAEKLAANPDMLRELSAAVRGGLPTMAECGGFMYLMEELEDENGRVFPATGVLHGRAFRTGKLIRFGYLSLSLRKERVSGQKRDSGRPFYRTPEPDRICERDLYRPDPGPRTLEQWLRLEGLGEIRGHEFHYYDTTDNGSACTASRKWKNRSWACMQLKDNLFAGFPHLYYYSNPKLPERFLRACLDFRKLREAANRPEF